MKTEKMLPFVRKLAYAISRRRPETSTVNFDDLVSAGTVGLVEALHRFDPALGVSEETFVRPTVLGHMLDALREADPLPKAVRHLATQIDRATRNLWAVRGHAPEADDVASFLGLTLEQFHAVKRAAATAAPLALDDVGENEAGYTDHAFGAVEARRSLKKLRRLPPVAREMLYLRFVDEVPSDEIGKRYGYSPSRTSQIFREIFGVVRELIEEDSRDVFRREYAGRWIVCTTEAAA